MSIRRPVVAGIVPHQMRRTTPILGGLALTASLLLCCSALAGSSVRICRSSPGPECFAYGSRPRTIYFGADGRFSYIRLKWYHWGARSATARGFRREDSGPAGEPNIIRHRIRMVARHPALCGGVRTYTKLIVHNPDIPRRVYRGCTLEF